MVKDLKATSADATAKQETLRQELLSVKEQYSLSSMKAVELTDQLESAKQQYAQQVRDLRWCQEYKGGESGKRREQRGQGKKKNTTWAKT